MVPLCLILKRCNIRQSIPSQMWLEQRGEMHAPWVSTSASACPISVWSHLFLAKPSPRAVLPAQLQFMSWLGTRKHRWSTLSLELVWFRIHFFGPTLSLPTLSPVSLDSPKGATLCPAWVLFFKGCAEPAATVTGHHGPVWGAVGQAVLFLRQNKQYLLLYLTFKCYFNA